MKNLSSKSIVLIDDSEDDAFITRRMLKKHGAIVSMHHIINPESCMREIKSLIQNGEDINSLIILLDINMPIVSGFEVLRKLRVDETLQKLPIIMFSSSSSGGDIHKSLAEGADGYLNKPFDPDALFEALMQVSDNEKRIIPDMVQLNG